jgi:hypothetical protein
MSYNSTNRATFVFLLLLLSGCGRSEPSTPTVPTNPPEAEPKPSTPAARAFDAVAEKELKAGGHFGPMEVEEAVRKYAGVRWRFQAEVVRLDAAEPNKFHTNTITVEPEGIARVYVRLRSPEAKSTLYPGQKHEFEGTFERYILLGGLDALVFNDATLVSP